jgi:hypothetical protein
MTKDKALALALEALEMCEVPWTGTLDHNLTEAITAIKQAIALDKKAENARELGLDYAPWESSDTAHRPGGLPQDFTKHEVESFDDWSEWVNPDSEQYFMKCCDCGLVHEMQFKVAKYAEGDACEFVEDVDLQTVFRARRTTPPAQPAPVQPIIGSYLEKDNSQFKFSDYESDGVHHNKPAVPDAFGTREGEHPQYIQGWNDCRQAMMEMKK